MKTNRISGLTRTLVIACSLALIAVLFLPVWRIELSAPQYPEGLVLQIYANKLGGNIDVVNGLNHYIGMKTLHTADFIEFKVLPYLITGLSIIGLIVGLLNRRKIFFGYIVLFVIVALVAMGDFYKWEYDYGHNLNPDAPIKVPGMAYQPPLIGYKQLLNFGAYSIPDSGGWIFVGVGFILVASGVFEIRRAKSKTKKIIVDVGKVAAFVCIIAGLNSCNSGPEPIRLGADNCDFCKMTISDPRFGAEIVTKKGRAYKFDDMHCIASFLKSGYLSQKEVAHIYLVDFSDNHTLLNADNALLFKSETLRSPMGGNTAAFAIADSMKKLSNEMKGESLSWKDFIR